MGLLMAICLVLAIASFTKNTDVKEYTGKVVDESSRPLYGASVTVKNALRGTTTDYKGIFSIRAAEKDVIEISMPGYETVSYPAGRLPETVILKMVVKIKEADKLIEIEVPQNALAGKVQSIMIRGNASLLNYVPQPTPNFNTEGYAATDENEFKSVRNNPLSTFSLDVDAASYSNIRRFINQGQIPAEGSVRVEEMINYFTYNYPQPTDNKPFSINVEYAAAPWNKDHGLMMINLQGKKVAAEHLPASNFVFLIDVSGSMLPANKLPLVQSSMKLLTDQLRAKDKVTIITYAGGTSVVLPATSGEEKTKIKDAVDKLSAGGSTHGSAAIELAYQSAQENFIKGGNNRIILCTDGDFNVGQTSEAALEKLIEDKRKGGVFLTILGYGMGNYKDNKMQVLAQKGNGNHAYIDGLTEARKVLITEFGGTMFTIAKDVKFQVEFNPAQVQGYRLVGYETRLLQNEDFNNDRKDAGEMGSGHTVTALYEIIPTGVKTDLLQDVDELKYQHKTAVTKNNSTELATVKIRYKEPEGNISKLLVQNISAVKKNLNNASEDFRFASAVAGFGQILSKSMFKGSYTFSAAFEQAKNALGKDEEGYRYEFIQLVKKTEELLKNDITYTDTLTE